MQVTIEDVEGHVVTEVGTGLEEITVRVTLVIDLDRMDDVVRRAYYSRSGIASWAGKGITAYVQDESEATNG